MAAAIVVQIASRSDRMSATARRQTRAALGVRSTPARLARPPRPIDLANKPALMNVVLGDSPETDNRRHDHPPWNTARPPVQVGGRECGRAASNQVEVQANSDLMTLRKPGRTPGRRVLAVVTQEVVAARCRRLDEESRA